MDIKHSTSPVLDGGIRKRMRKGTHSCFECRRRKIRCIFSPNNSRVCTECFARGSQCIDQEHADPSVILDQRKNLRERVAKLEELVNTLLDDRVDSKAAHTLTNFRSDMSPPTPRSGDSMSPTSAPPTVSRSWEPSNTFIHQPSETPYNQFAQLFPETSSHGKNERVILALKKLLPSHEKLQMALDENKDWWKTITTSMVGPGGTPQNMTSIYAYAEYALSTGTPMDVAKILQIVVKSVDLEEQQFEAIVDHIDQLIIHDDEYMGTLAGVEVATWHSRYLGDTGQSRKAWLIIRRAVSFAQLMGLHRNRVNMRQDFAFWGLYQFDRFLSLILGVPYALSDVHCNLTFGKRGIPMIFDSNSFLTRLAIVAGKVIDRTHAPPASPEGTVTSDSSFKSLLAIDDELVALKSKLPAEYWDLPSVAPKGFKDSTEWIQRVLALIMHNQTRLILHLPNLFRISGGVSSGFGNNMDGNGQSINDEDEGNDQSEYSRKICLDLARSTLQILQIARLQENISAYKNIAIDFLGVIAAVVLVIDIIKQRHVLATQSIKSTSAAAAMESERSADWDLVQMALDTYNRAEKMPFNKVAIQARRVLAQLLQFRDPEEKHEPTKILIPFFGTITMYSGRIQENCMPAAGGRSDIGAGSLPGSSGQANTKTRSATVGGGSNTGNYPAKSPTSAYGSTQIPHAGTTPTSNNSPITPIVPSSTTMPASSLQHSSQFTGVHSSIQEPPIAYDGVYMPYDNGYFFTSGMQGMSSRMPGAHLPPGWQNVGTFDLDQDWTWLMSDAASMAGGH